MDILSDVLRVVQLNGAVFLNGTFGAPWAVMTGVQEKLRSSFLPGSKRVVSFHLITAGTCWAALPGEPDSALHLEAGELLVVPQGETHILGSATDLDPVNTMPMLEEHVSNAPGQILSLRYGGDGAEVSMVCGFLASDSLLDNPLLSALPRLFKVRIADTAGSWIEHSLSFAASEAAGTKPGSALVLGKLSELLFVEAVRRYAESLPEDETGWLAGLRDRYVGRALVLLHARPEHAWTIEELGREVGMSRSALARRFTDLLGRPPMQYLAHWRLQLAARWILAGERSVGAIAETVGYESEAAFSRAFKREFGMPPAAWRRNGRKPLDAASITGAA